MKKIKLLLVALLSCLCCFAFSSCTWLNTQFALLFVSVALDEDKNAPTDEERLMAAEIVQDAVITEITQNEVGMYVVKAEGAIKNPGDKDADELHYVVAFYDEKGYLLDTLAFHDKYVGAGDTYKVECEFDLFYKPATARIYNVELYSAYDYAAEREAKAEVELATGETFVCGLGEDGLYHATVCGQVKLLSEGNNTVYVYVAFYDADGYLYVREWNKLINGPAERTYEVECDNSVEIVSYKVIYASTIVW